MKTSFYEYKLSSAEDNKRAVFSARNRSFALLVFGSILFTSTSHGATFDTFTVTRFDDPIPGVCSPSDCSLREADLASGFASRSNGSDTNLSGTDLH